MKHTSYIIRLFLLFLFSLFCINITFASSLRQYSVRDGLSDPVVSSIYQDHNGLIWLGTSSGINTFDGLHIQGLLFGEQPNPFTGSIVGNIFEMEDDILWITTDRALYRFNRRNLKVETFDGFDLDTKITSGHSNDVYAIKEDNFINYYLSPEEGFKKIPVKDLVFDSVMEMFVDNNNNLWVFTDDGNHRGFTINRDETGLSLTPSNQFRHPEPILWCFYEDGSVYFVDATLTFFEYNLSARTKYYIQDVREEVVKYGEISSVIKHQNDFFMGFAGEGLLRIKNMPEQRNKYQLEKISLNAGVLSLATDKYQDIVWVGTNGQGVYMYFNETSSLDAVLGTSLPNPVRSPLTALHVDRNQTLWIATSGEGVVAIHDYDPEKESGGQSGIFSTYNSLLGSNSVYALAPSNKNLLWVGTENSLNYYSYNERRMKNIQVVADGKPLKQVRSVCELNDTTLWVTTAGEGVVKIRLAGDANNPIIVQARRFTVGDGGQADNMFTVAYKDDNNTVWFGTQNNGVYKMDSRAEKMEPVQLGMSKGGVYAIHKNNQGYWLGTTGGLVNLNNSQKTIYNDQNGLPCKEVNGILEGGNGNLWLSTNKGLIRFDLKQHTSHLCKQSSEKAITEFTNGAYFKSPMNNTLFFGGSNGFVTVNENEFTHQEYTPHVQFTGLSVFGTQENIYDYLSIKRKTNVLKLNYDQNVFALSFVANDFIDGADYNYFYKLNEQSDSWVDNGASNVAFFTYLKPGTYTLSAKYRNNVTGKESPASLLKVRIMPPWYQSWWAYTLYVLLVALTIYGTRWYLLFRNKKKVEEMREEIEHRFLEDTNRMKLRFFVHMANELYTPLTMMLNPVRKILSLSSSNKEIHTYADVIQQNAAQVDEFIRNMSELRLLESGERTPQIQTLPVSELIDLIAEGFIGYAHDKDVNYQIKIDTSVYWNTDSYCLRTIISNLLVHTFLHVNSGGTVSLKLSVVEDNLRIVISGNKMTLDREKLSELFNHNTLVERLETQSKEGFSLRHELILAICITMAKLLQGEAKIEESTEEGTVSFVVMLPQLSIETEDEEALFVEEERPLIAYNQVMVPRMPEYKKDTSKMTIMLLINDPSLLWLLADQLTPQYNVEVHTDVSQLQELVKVNNYGLIVSEVHLPGTNGIELVKGFKQNRSCSHIPWALLASENTFEEKLKAIEAGAELYINKPFDMEIFEKEVNGILQYKELQEYYTASLSRTFELGDESFASKEDREFYDQMLHIIERNLANPELSVEMICNELQCTSQQFYTKLKEITRKTPNEIIREYRLNAVELLLAATTLSVDEIFEKSGFPSRSTFFKVFAQKYGMTPRNYREQHKQKIRKGIGN